MEQDLIEAKKYLSQQGYGSETNYTTNLVAVLLANYAHNQVKKFRLGAVIKNEVAVCELNALNGDYCENYRSKAECSRCDFWKQTVL